MRVSRRMFLSVAASAPLLAGDDRPRAECHLVDLGHGCVVRESLAGFQMALQQAGLGQDERARHLIIPGAGVLDDAALASVHRQLGRGGTVLLECCTQLEGELGIEVGGRAGRGGSYFPYVDYSWPVRVKIREFRPVWLLPAAEDEVIGTFAGRAVALRRRVGDGTLLVMGSPIGPVFLTGDPDARLWLEGFFIGRE